jgi:diaminopimelate epimerase
MRFAKYHGLGNDFLIVDLRGGAPAGPSVEDARAAVALCDRHTGVGGDGVLAVLPATTPGAHARMRVLNADGSEAEMCGNGIRTVVKYLHERDPALALPALTIDTGAGPLTCAVAPGGGRVDTVTVDMGRPRLSRGEIPMTGPADERCVAAPLTIEGRTLAVTAVSMGNPHAVAFVPESGAALRALAEAIGPAIETHPWFPRRTNVELAHPRGDGHIELVVWERGCGITLACGTGACATAVAACLGGHARPGDELRVTLLGGDLAITVAPDYATVFMRGPARHVYDAELDLAALLA